MKKDVCLLVISAFWTQIWPETQPKVRTEPGPNYNSYALLIQVHSQLIAYKNANLSSAFREISN